MRLVVRRFDPDRDAAPQDVTYEVPEYPGMTVLDALIWVRQHLDPTVAVRYACRNANACKTCVARVNGSKTYLCTYPARGEVRDEPLPHKPLVRDLVVDDRR